MSRKDKRRNNKFKKKSVNSMILNSNIIKSSDYDIVLQEKYRTSKIKGWEIAVVALAAILLAIVTYMVILISSSSY